MKSNETLAVIIGKCAHCGDEFSTTFANKLYCDNACGKAAQKSRQVLRSNPIISIKCCICGLEVKRHSKIRGGQKPKTCGSAKCLRLNRKSRQSTYGSDIRKRWRDKYMASPKMIEKEFLRKDLAAKRKEQKRKKRELSKFKSQLKGAIREVKRRILARDGKKICAKCKRVVDESKWNRSRCWCNECANSASRIFRRTDAGKRQYARRQQKIKSNPELLCRIRIRGRVSKAMRMYARGVHCKGPKVRYLGCTYKQAYQYLTSQFKQGMSWANFGKHWHIDHVFPLASFDLTSDIERHKAFHYTNLQPLEAHKNIIKSDSIPVEHQPLLMYA